jgi:hypothetical protein
MKIIINIFVVVFLWANVYSQEVVFEKQYSDLPFGLRIENSGIYSIASFDVSDKTFSFTSFDKPGIFKFVDDEFSSTSLHLKNGSDFVNANLEYVKTDNSLLKKNYFNGLSILNDKDGIVENNSGSKITVAVPNKNELIVTSNIAHISNYFTLDFSSNLACADFIGIDKSGNLFIEVQKYLSEVPLQVEREVKIFSKAGKLISTINLPEIKYLYTLKDLQIDEDGNLYQLLSYPDKFQIIKWNHQTYSTDNVINFLNTFNYKIHYNDFVTTNEYQPDILFTDDLNVGTSRRDALRIADTYTLHQYVCSSSNLAPSNVTDPGGDIVRTPSWLVVGTNARIPYKWGGFSTIAQFDAGMANGRYAGDIHTDGVSSYAYGVDCSGYVSRCWQMTYHASTSYMPTITTQYASWDNLKPGDAIHKVGHVRLFLKRNTNGSFKIIEASARNWDVSYWSYSASDLTTYTPRYYNSMEVNYNSQTPVLQSAVAENQNIVKLNWSCDSTDILGYRVYGSLDGNNWNLLLNENSCTITYANLTTTNSEKYFRISSVKNDSPDFSESHWSNILGSTYGTSIKKALVIDGLEREAGSWQGIGIPFVTKYGNALQEATVDFISIRTSELQNGSFNLNDYDYVFWILADESTIDETFNSVEQQLVKIYLEEGGNLFVSGSEIGWDLDYKGSASDKDFYNNYLKADYVSDDALSSSVIGVANTAFDGCIFNIGQTYEEDFPDEIIAYGGSTLCIKYSNNKGAGIQFAGYLNNSINRSSLIHLAFPLETTANDESFNSVITKSINYFNTAQVGVDEEIQTVNKFSLEQNFPNPFNPTTKISWQSPVNSHQALKVYDVLGNEVVTLVNEYRTAGKYEAEFNANKLASGIYYYQLKIGEFIQTRKMILLK